MISHEENFKTKKERRKFLLVITDLYALCDVDHMIIFVLSCIYGYNFVG